MAWVTNPKKPRFGTWGNRHLVPAPLVAGLGVVKEESTPSFGMSHRMDVPHAKPRLPSLVSLLVEAFGPAQDQRCAKQRRLAVSLWRRAVWPSASLSLHQVKIRARPSLNWIKDGSPCRDPIVRRVSYPRVNTLGILVGHAPVCSWMLLLNAGSPRKPVVFRRPAFD